jgi:hypothetical protein
MEAKIELTHDPERELYLVRLLAPSLEPDRPHTDSFAFSYESGGPYDTAQRALIAAEGYAAGAAAMARVLQRGGVDHNAGGFFRLTREAQEIDEAKA